MRKPDLYKKTVDKLITAYENGLLVHGDCGACAVGNLCGGWKGWAVLFITSTWKTNGKQMTQSMLLPFVGPEVSLGAEKLSGYSIAELKKIEFAFESAPGWERFKYFECGVCRLRGESATDPEWMYNGLKAVLEVLAEIHELDKGDESSLQRLSAVYSQLELV